MYAVIYRLFIFNYNMFYARQFNAAVTAVLPYLIIYNYIYLPKVSRHHTLLSFTILIGRQGPSNLGMRTDIQM